MQRNSSLKEWNSKVVQTSISVPSNDHSESVSQSYQYFISQNAMPLSLYPSPDQPLGKPELLSVFLHTLQEQTARRMMPRELELTMFILCISCICSYTSSIATRFIFKLQGGHLSMSWLLPVYEQYLPLVKLEILLLNIYQLFHRLYFLFTMLHKSYSTVPGRLSENKESFW